MKKLLRFFLAIVVIFLGVYFYYYPTTKNTTTIANPATLFCLQNSGTSEIVTDASGGQSGICHLLDGTTCDEQAYFRGECPATGTVEITGTIETSGGLMDQVSQEITNQQTNVFIYQPLGISFTIPAGRTAGKFMYNPCAETDCSSEVLRITTDQKDTKGYVAYALFNVRVIDQTKKSDQEYIQNFENKENIVLVDRSEKKLIQLEGVAGAVYIIKTAGTYYYIEMLGLMSEQPRPANLDDVWNPIIPNENTIYKKLDTIIKSITK